MTRTPAQRSRRRTDWLVSAAVAAAVIAGSALAIGSSRLQTAPPVPADVQPPSHIVVAVALVGITVSNLDRSVDFYTSVLGFQKISESEESGEVLEHLSGVFGARCRTARLRLGDELVDLTQFLAPEGRPIPGDSRSNDRWFQHIAIVVSDIDRAYRVLREHNVRHASSGPQTLPDWNPNAGGISAFYFKDPDGHVLEIINFPDGKGDPRWRRLAAAQGQPASLFLGIDHTAIVVGNTEQSLAFYRDTLGMQIAGAAENYGTEQEHLNNVFGAHLRITALRAESGPGIELLEYLAPADGRDYPRDARANDLVSWHTTLITPDAPAAEARLRQAHAPWVSPGFINVRTLDRSALSAQVRDPDGHALYISQVTSSAPEPRASAH